MHQSFEQYKTYESVKLSYLKNRGNELAVLKDLDWPEDDEHITYLKKILKKIKGAEDRNVSQLIANNLMSHVLLGSQSRNAYLMDMLRSLDREEKPAVSICCNKPFQVEPETPDTPKQFRCMSCRAICQTHTPPKSTIYKIKVGILEHLREEDIAVVEMADKMGYTNKVDPVTTVINNKPNILVLGSNPEEQKVIEDYSALSMMDKERLIEKLRKHIVNADGPDIHTEGTEETETEVSTGTDTLS